MAEKVQAEQKKHPLKSAVMAIGGLLLLLAGGAEIAASESISGAIAAGLGLVALAHA